MHEWIRPGLDSAADLALIFEIDFPSNHQSIRRPFNVSAPNHTIIAGRKDNKNGRLAMNNLAPDQVLWVLIASHAVARCMHVIAEFGVADAMADRPMTA